MLLYTKDIKMADAENVFKEYNVSDKDMAKYNKMIESGDIQKAMDDFTEKYILSTIEAYQSEAMKYFDAGVSGEIDKKNSTALYASIIALSIGFKETIQASVSQIFKSIAKQIFIDEGVQNVAAKNAILEATINAFNQLIEGAMTETQAAILQPIRDAQRLFIAVNQNIAKNGIKGKELDALIKQFKKDIRIKIPQIESVAKDGLLLNRAGKSYQFDKYFEMATQTTALNIQRHAVEYMAEVDQDQIVEYFLADDRKLKTSPREICKNVLSDKISGKSYVALTQEAASKLGIKLLSTVKSKGGLKPNCRHSIRRVPSSVQKELLSA